jgi:hypothetical protein
MNYDIDNAIEKVTGQPWELTLTVGGKQYSVRPLQVADVDRLGQMSGTTRREQDLVVQDLFAPVGGLGDGPLPDVSAWTPTQISHVVSAVIGYQRGRVLKNCQAVASELATATARE